MDRLVWLTWRAFWVGLGACAVLVVQTMSHGEGAAPARDPGVVAREAPPSAPRVQPPGV